MIQIYTDGSCDLNNSTVNNTGGIGIVILKDKKIIKQISKTFKNTTNNKMELLAIIESLIFCLKNEFSNEEIIIYSDSQYCVQGCSEWIKKWAKKGFTKQGGLLNAELWIVVDSLISNFEFLSFEWVKGHNGDQYNEMADKLSVSYKPLF